MKLKTNIMKTQITKFRNNNTLIALCITVLIAIVTFNVSAQTSWNCYSGNVQTLYNGYQPGNAGNFTVGRMNTNVPLQYQYILNAPCKKIHTVYNNSGNGNNIQNTEVHRVGDNNFVYNGSTESVFKAASSAHWAVLKARKYFMDETPFQGFSIGSITLNVITNNIGMETDLHFVGGVNLMCGKKNGKDYVSLDMIGRQYAKYVVNYTTGFGYNNSRTLTQDNEDGAMLESFGDIFGTMIERDVEGSGFNWLIGEDMTTIRNMTNPKSMNPPRPDTYEGNFWSFSDDRYINCNVMNYWFYLLAQGGTGTNDKGDSYNVQGIGINNAMEIVYKTFTTLHNSHGFSGIATKTLQNAEFLFGNNSNEYIQACNAWYAVGVRNAPCSVNANPTGGNPGGGNTSTLSAPNSVTQPNDFTVSFNTSGYQAGTLRLIIFDNNNTAKVNESLHSTSGSYTVPSTSGWATGTCRIFLAHVPSGATIASETFTLNQSTVGGNPGGGNPGGGNPGGGNNFSANLDNISSVNKPDPPIIEFSSTGYQSTDHFAIKIYDGNNVLQVYTGQTGTSGTFSIGPTTDWATDSCRVELYDMNNVLKDTEQFMLRENQQRATISSLGTVVSPDGFTFSYNSNGYAPNEEFTIRVFDGNNDLKETLNRSSFTNSGSITISSTTGFATGTCRIKIYDSNNSIKDMEYFNLYSVSINSPGTVIKPIGFQFAYTAAGFNSNDNISITIYDSQNIIRHSWSHVGDANVTVPEGSVNSGYAFGSIINGLGNWTIPSTSTYHEGPCVIRLFANNTLVDSVLFILEEPSSINCESYATNTGSLWIDSIGLGDIQNQTGDDDGFADYTHVSTVLTDGMEITLNPGFNVAPQLGMFWNIWIDFNQDGDFDDNNELAFQTEQHAFLRGDANDDGQVNMSDMIFIYNVLFQGGGNFANEDAADVNDDGMINITDGVFLSNYLFAGTVSALPEPFLTPGIDPTPDNLGVGSLTGTINVPVDALEGETKMRIQMKYGSFSTNACEVFSLGEVEDYTVEIVGGSNKMMADDENTVANTTGTNETEDEYDEQESEASTFIEDLEELKLSINTYPNPATTHLNIKVEGVMESNFSYQLIDLSGRLIDQQMDLYGGSTRIDVSQLPKGIYMINVQAGNQHKTNKVMVR